jgi:hypothetical protein
MMLLLRGLPPLTEMIRKICRLRRRPRSCLPRRPLMMLKSHRVLMIQSLLRTGWRGLVSLRLLVFVT